MKFAGIVGGVWDDFLHLRRRHPETSDMVSCRLGLAAPADHPKAPKLVQEELPSEDCGQCTCYSMDHQLSDLFDGDVYLYRTIRLPMPQASKA